MKLIPAIDLINNKCVRLSQGKESTSHVYNDNPIELAKFLENEGCKRIHIVDLDAAFGRPGINKKTILGIRDSVSMQIQMGGGIKSKEEITYWLGKKIDYLILGSFAVKYISDVISLANANKNKIYISVDQLNNQILVKGWEEASKFKVNEFFKIYNKSNIVGFVVTDVSRDGMMKGINLDFINYNLSVSEKSLIVGGGLSNYEDLKNLNKIKNKNLEGVIAGKAFYSGSIEIKKSIKILE